MFYQRLAAVSSWQLMDTQYSTAVSGFQSLFLFSLKVPVWSHWTLSCSFSATPTTPVEWACVSCTVLSSLQHTLGFFPPAPFLTGDYSMKHHFKVLTGQLSSITQFEHKKICVQFLEFQLLLYSPSFCTLCLCFRWVLYADLFQEVPPVSKTLGIRYSFSNQHYNGSDMLLVFYCPLYKKKSISYLSLKRAIDRQKMHILCAEGILSSFLI